MTLRTPLIRIVLLFCSLWLVSTAGRAQDSCWDCDTDSLKRALRSATTDAARLHLLTLIVDLQGVSIGNRFIDSAAGNRVRYVDSLLHLNRTLKAFDPAPYERLREAMVHYDQRDYASALRQMQEAVELFDRQKKIIVVLLANIRNLYNLLKMQEERLHYYAGKLNDYLAAGPVQNAAPCHHALGGYYIYKAEYNLAISHYLKAAELYKSFYQWYYINDVMVVGDTYALWGNYERAKYYLHQSLPLIRSVDNRVNLAFCLASLARIAYEQGQYRTALDYAGESAILWRTTRNIQGEAVAVLLTAKIHLAMNQPRAALPLVVQAGELGTRVDSDLNTLYGNFEEDYVYYQYYRQVEDPVAAERHLRDAYAAAVAEDSEELQLKYLRELYQFYEQGGREQLAGQYAHRYFTLKDAVEAKHNRFKVASYEYEQSDRRKQDSIRGLQQQRLLQDVKLAQRATVLWISLAAFAIVLLLLLFIYRQLKINRRTLHELKRTQDQLVLHEKMASLGELTAGVAHEIQNPLNFINNFAEVNAELLGELEEELAQGHGEGVLALSRELRDNEQLIGRHGRRAEAIVKGMLQHARTSTGKKESADINALVKEFIHLSYEGLRAKDPAFSARVETRLDEHLHKIALLPQDMGRVLLNLFNNAFYAVRQKKQLLNGAYSPVVLVTTERQEGKVEIRIRDNGTGIPTGMVDKVFQPFFTTKPAGEGTGLGLSLSYDIITKGHGGTLRINSREGEYAEVIISLPAEER